MELKKEDRKIIKCRKPYRGKSGIFFTSWTEPHPKTGVPRTAVQTLETRDEDEAYLTYLEVAAKLNKIEAANASGQRTIHWCLDYYLENRVPDAEVVEKDNPKRQIAMWKAYFSDTMLPQEITDVVLSKWEASRRMDRKFPKGGPLKKDGTPKINRPVMPGTLRAEKSKLNTVFKFCVDNKQMSAAQRPTIKLGKQPKGREGHIDDDQFVKLMAMLETANSPCLPGREGKLPGVAIWAWLMFATACRPNEARLLEWDKVDLDGREIDFTLDGRIDTCKVRNPEAPIPDALLSVLRRAKAERVSKWVCIEPICFDNTFMRYVRKAGLPTTGKHRISPHSMRHSRVSLVVNSGIDATEATDLFALDIKTLVKTYYHGNKKRRAENANRSSDQKKLLRTGIKVVKQA